MSAMTRDQHDLLPALSAGHLAAKRGDGISDCPQLQLGIMASGMSILGGTQPFLYPLRCLLFHLGAFSSWFAALQSRWQCLLWLELQEAPPFPTLACMISLAVQWLCQLLAASFPTALRRLDPYFVCTGCLMKDVPV